MSQNIQQETSLRSRNMEIFIGKWLRYGVFTSAAIAIVGGILYLFQSKDLPDYKHFIGADKRYRHLPGIWNGVHQLDGASIIQFAAVILIATPIMRIVFSVIAFAIEKDKMYVVITLIVLSIILFGMFSGLGG